MTMPIYQTNQQGVCADIGRLNTPKSETLVQAQMQQRAVEYTQHLVRIDSITPHDKGCQRWIAEKLVALGFTLTWLDSHGVTNLVAHLSSNKCGEKRGKERGKCFAFAGHTDVVPAGDESRWKVPPFSAEIVNGKIVGRGVADMKGGVAAMLAAIETLCLSEQELTGDIYFLLTSDEEGEAEHGTKVIKAWLDQQGINLDYCLVGEPTSNQEIGDTIKVGRRGALSARVTCEGKQGHVAYPTYAVNAIHKMSHIISALTAISWDEGSDDFPGSSLQITHVNSGQFTDNIIPAQCWLSFNIRYSHRFDEQSLKSLISSRIIDPNNTVTLEWQRPCQPYITVPHNDPEQDFIRLVESAIVEQRQRYPVLSTSGGTSDGRFLASEKTQVIELGLKNNSIHQVNENAPVSDIEQLSALYLSILTKVCLAE